jgi:hypothetical protein
MWKRIGLALVPTIVLAVPSFAPFEMLGQAHAQQQGDARASKTTVSFDSYDLSGVWNFFAAIPGQGIYGTASKEAPPMTEWAQARYDAAKPGFGPKAQLGGNDPILECEPSGFPRILYYLTPYEIVQAPDRMFMFFERDHTWRQIWTDGRGHPKDLEPTWMGDSIGAWVGDIFVVDTVGFNDKSWLDTYGNPHSEQMHIVERYKRVDRNTLTMQLIIDDPKAYTKTWVGDTKIFKLLPPEQAVVEESHCIYSEEQAFKNRIRMPAAGKQPNK